MIKVLKILLACIAVICFYTGYALVWYNPLLFGTLELLSIAIVIILFWIQCNTIYVNGVRIKRIK